MKLVRYFWRMVIDLDQKPPEPKWPRNITLSTLADLGDLRLFIVLSMMHLKIIGDMLTNQKKKGSLNGNIGPPLMMNLIRLFGTWLWMVKK